MFPSVSIPASVVYWTFCSGIVVAASAKLRRKRKLTSTHLHTLHLRFRVNIFNGHRKSEFVPGLLPSDLNREHQHSLRRRAWPKINGQVHACISDITTNVNCIIK